jgi:hypothetical protein
MERSATAAADLTTIELGFVEDDDPELDVWAARIRGSSRRVSIRIGEDELVIDGATTESQEQLVVAFLSRHSVSWPGTST